MPSKLKLRPWTFTSAKKMRLYWLCSPFKDEKKRWTVKAVFTPISTKLPSIEAIEESRLPFNDHIEPKYYILNFPWGMLPNLRVGRIYIDGVVEEISPTVSTGYLSISDFQKGYVCRAFDIPTKLYSFFSDYQLGKEKIWRFQNDGKTYFLPCLEIIRAFFATSKTLTNQLLKPHGLDSLITDEKFEKNTLSVTLSHEIPQAIIKPAQVTHLLWVYYDELARNCWESVYNKLFMKAIKMNPIDSVTMLSNGLPLEVLPPLLGKCWMKFTGTTRENYCLIHEILEIYGFPELPYEKINYIHPSFKKDATENKGTKQKSGVPVKNKGSFKQDSTRRKVKTNKNQPVAKVPETVFGFSKLPNLKRQNLSSNVIASEQKLENNVQTQRTGTSSFISKEKKESVGTDESYVGGSVSPVEFLGLKLILSEDKNGLTNFFETIDHVAELNPKLSITRKIYNLPSDFSFCSYKDTKRNVAIIYVVQEDIQPVYIIEVARPDRWAVSTILIQFSPKINNRDKINQILLDMINEMITNNGHWQMDKIRQSSDLTFIRVRHFKDDSPKTRAIEILQKLWILGLR